MLLSVLVAGVPSRLATGVPASLGALLQQAKARADVEVLYLVDNKKRTIGAKRTALLQIARGAYVSYVDDDDEVAIDYIENIAQAAARGTADVIVFPIKVTLDGASEGIVEPSVLSPVQEKYHANGVTKRRPIQIACWRRSLVADIAFPDTSIGEDHAWGDLASARVITEERIDMVLYHYKFNSSVTEVNK